jgi:hypothetical protein
MDNLLPKLLSFPQHPSPTTPLTDTQYDEGIRAQIKAVKDISENKLLQYTSSGENVLDVNPLETPTRSPSLTAAGLVH